jgi:hypothetical protein
MIEVVNNIGQLVYKANLNEGKNAIELKDKIGIYFYRVLENSKTIHSGKIIVEK